MPTCPNGHQSGSDDWCEVCGHRMAPPGAPAGAVPPPPPPPPGYGYPGPADPNATAQAELCPQCRTPREAMAPFCEECRYNFLTHTATSYTPVAPPPQQQGGLNLPPGFQSQPGPPWPPAQHGAPPPPPQQQRDPFEYQGSRPSQMNRPAEPLGQEPPGHQQHQQPHQQQHQQQQQPGAFQQQGGPPPPPSPFQQQSGPPAPPAFQQQPGPPAPPAFQQQQSGRPAPQPQQTGGGDDWMLPPPSRTQSPPPPPGHQGPQGHQGPPPFPQQSMPPQHQQGPGMQGMHPGQQPPQQQAAPAGWTAVVGPDREYFMAMMQRSGPEATGLNLPAYSPEQHLPLTGGQITIGRRRQSTGESPDIDLSVPPEDPGVSHQHAVLVQQPDGSWAVVDQNSTNGTTLNGAEDPIQPYVPIPLNDGDRVHVGAWTTITVRRG
ncbi:FHA domain-containing protein [Streptomyces sp. Tu 2975]|uniref:FHA domain-containing protein n=1 Tax=Streptomyces sp. Tu 2975 TaxID=2676871 RepID=UPI00135C095A|nr:FHA domain-containing protein [Streptomyces sp. Tu 2975]QIP86464.1 FHA domain-containing protein [Streptomyces sp. Tu 2975]